MHLNSYIKTHISASIKLKERIFKDENLLLLIEKIALKCINILRNACKSLFGKGF